MAGTGPRQRERHHPPVGSTLRRERADSAGYRVKGAQLQPRSQRPATHQQHRRATAEEIKPHHGTLRTTTTIGELTETQAQKAYT
jgi:hypothetical protein